ncbi:MAG: hypothetical protein L6406_19940 [Desulfobacterales bacterium]|nr:hypothetical protein [Desulfobacterales bacterium]
MNDKKTKNIPLSSKADAAFRQAIKKVIQQARQTNTPVVIWEENRIKEIPCDQLEATMGSTQPKDVRF